MNRFSKQGRALPYNIRKDIVDLRLNNKRPNEISSEFKLPPRTIHNIIEKFIDTDGNLQPSKAGKFRSARTDDVITYIEYTKKTKPSTYAAEIQRGLEENNICFPENIPSTSSISRVLRDDLGYTKKKLTVVAKESLMPANTERLTEFLARCITADPNTLHFFDECSVVRTTGNRVYGHSSRGKKAIEIQKYASDATFTVNLLVNIDGITHVDIIPGASNGLEMLNFFAAAVEQRDQFDNPLIKQGDTIIMDNCGFHHGAQTEPILRNIIEECGARLIFQPPYHPQYNVCELWFHSLKCYLRKYSRFTERHTDIAILSGLRDVTCGTSRAYFKYCGYLL